MDGDTPDASEDVSNESTRQSSTDGEVLHNIAFHTEIRDVFFQNGFGANITPMSDGEDAHFAVCLLRGNACYWRNDDRIEQQGFDDFLIANDIDQFWMSSAELVSVLGAIASLPGLDRVTGPRQPRYRPGTKFWSGGKQPRECMVTDHLRTYNLAEELVDSRYVATHEFLGQTVEDRNVVETSISMRLISEPE